MKAKKGGFENDQAKVSEIAEKIRKQKAEEESRLNDYKGSKKEQQRLRNKALFNDRCQSGEKQVFSQEEMDLIACGFKSQF